MLIFTLFQEYLRVDENRINEFLEWTKGNEKSGSTPNMLVSS